MPSRLSPFDTVADLPPDERLSPAIASLVAYWRSIRPAAGLLPGRLHVDPQAIASILPFVWLMDVERGPRLRFRMRLTGTALAEAGGLCTVRVPMDELHGEAWAPLQAEMESVVHEARPSHRKGPPQLGHGPDVVALERIALPLAADGRRVDMVLGATVHVWAPGTAPRAHRYGAGA